MDTAPGAPAGAHVRRSRDRGVLACLAGGIGLLAFLAFSLSGAGSDQTRTWVTDVVYIPVEVLAVALAGRASRHRALARRTRLAWRILAAAFACQLFADTAWWWLEAVRGDSVPLPSLADVGYLAFIPVLLAGLLAFPGRPASRQERYKLALDTATVVTGGFMVLWYLVLGPVVTKGGAGFLTLATSVAYPAGDLVLLIGIAEVLLRGPATSSRRPLQILVVGLALFVVADVYYGYVALHQGFIGGSWPDLLWLGTDYLFAVSALEQHRRAEHLERRPRKARAWHLNHLPYLGVALGYGLLLLIAGGERLYPLGGVLIGAVVLTAMVVLRQITALRENHELVVTDSLTGLVNRVQLRAILDRALARGRGGDRRVAVLLLDLDGFKQINDSLGHETGDDVLVAFADVLRRCVRAGDTAGRLGADEFAVIIEPVYGADDPDELLHQADLAMYAAKRRGTHGYEVFGHIPDDRELRRAQLETDVRLALDREELVVYYQPIVTLHDGNVVGVEALVRWQHPSRGLIPPGEFIPVAEDTGLIQELGAWVLQHAGRQVRAWQERYPGTRPLQLSVNLSPRQVQDPHLVQDVGAILRRIGLDPRTLVLELTENVFMHDTDEAIAKLAALKQLGIRIAIDDFGTGYSSLGYLTHLPVDILKIDRCFIAELGTGSEGSVVVEAVVRLSQALHLDTVAEGIEAANQAEGLRELGCQLGQGYYFAHPLSSEAFEELLEAARAPAAPRADQPQPAPAGGSTVRSS